MATFNAYNVSDTVEVELYPVSREIKISVGQAEIRLSPSEFRLLVEKATELLADDIAARVELGL